MSENTTPVVVFTLERNNIVRNIVQGQYTRDPKKGQIYLKPEELTLETFDAGVEWFGKQMICDIVNAKAAQMGQNITDQATSEVDGKLDEGLAKQYFAEFSTRGETKAELEEKKESLLVEMLAASKAGDGEKVRTVGEQIQSVLVAIESKKRERTPKQEPATTA
jgi:hypothetical protein